MKFLQWIDYVHSFWQEYVSRGCIHTDKMVTCANNSLLRDQALKFVMSSFSSLRPVSALSIKVGFVVWLSHLGWLSPVVAGLAAGWRSCASHASASRAVKTQISYLSLLSAILFKAFLGCKGTGVLCSAGCFTLTSRGLRIKCIVLLFYC